MSNYDLIETSGVPIKAWTRGVGVEDAARRQLENVDRQTVATVRAISVAIDRAIAAIEERLLWNRFGL